MNKARLALAGLVIGAILAVGIGLFVYSASRARVSKVGKHPILYYKRLQQFLWKQLPATYRLEVTGPTGTPVIVGYRLDGSHSGILRGTIPTNCIIKARRRVDVAIKNMGTNCVRLGFMLHGLSPGAAGGGGSEWGDFPQFYGFSGEYHFNPQESGGGPIGILTPTNWPVTLPLGVTEQQAKTKDFGRELIYLRLKDAETRLAQNPTDQRVLAAAGSYYLQINNRSAAEGVYQRFFATDCNDAMFLNIVVYQYADNGGTNLNRAYELALKALKLAEERDRSQLPYIKDTVAWIQIKRGYYREGLDILRDLKAPQFSADGVVNFHLGKAYYMLMKEDAAAEVFQRVVATQRKDRVESAEVKEARKCLTVLHIKEDSPKSKIVAKLQQRVNEVPDDPVALKSLADACSADGAPPNEASNPLALKALGFRAYRGGEYSNAVAFLSESGKARANDAELFFYLGMAQSQSGQRKEGENSLHKALTLGLKPAQIEELTKALAAVPSTGLDTNSTRQ